ncbi:MAG: hypothetical protein DHS80DRAFT_24556 [Piptocephalis tieghemiana]|nr:MAG: hypothetical protein DHS80DRAFT_24556 [Piptocephalis tieghemiana]
MALANYFVLLDVTWKENVLLVSLGSLLCSFGSEFVQGLLPYREFDWWDILANVLGSALGIGAAIGGEECVRRRRLRREARYGHLVEEGDWMATLMEDEEDGSGDGVGVEMYRRDILEDIEEELWMEGHDYKDGEEEVKEVVVSQGTDRMEGKGEGEGEDSTSRMLSSGR